ncbi:MAG: TPD domain-containing protein [Methanobacteriota archaeon]
MNDDEYRVLSGKLQKPSDIMRLAKELNLEPELLLIIHTQRIVRDATRRYYQVKRDIPRMTWNWKGGMPLVKIARRYDFPPILVSLMVLSDAGMSRKAIWSAIREPDKIRDPRLKREILEVNEEDLNYSPKGMDIQSQRGRVGEERLHSWLDAQLLEYRTEPELKGKYPKTPDCLLKHPVRIQGQDIFWFESKAIFGDSVEIRRNLKKQLIPYTELFGNGIVVYWFGYVDNFRSPEGVRVVDASFFEKSLAEWQKP